MEIYLVRHGEATAPWHHADDPGLSELGRRQAAEAAEILRSRIEGDVRVVSSPLKRAQETAQPLGDSLRAGVAIREAFAELPAPVALADRQEWLREIYRQGWGEQIDSVRDWHRALLDELQQLREPTVVFTHFMVLNAIVGEVTGDDRLVCFVPDNASITTLRRRGDTLELVELGQQIDKVLE